MLLIVALAFAVWGILSREQEPRYQGRTLGCWLEILDNKGTTSVTPAQVAQAEQAVRQIGTNAIPFLLKWIMYEPRPWQIRLSHRIHQMPAPFGLLARMTYNQGELHRAGQTILGFKILGKQRASAIPELISMLDRTNSLDLRREASHALASLGSDGLPPLLQVLDDPSYPNRSAVAAAVLWGYLQDTNAITAIPVLVRCTKDNDPAVAAMAVQALASLQIEIETVIPALTNAFRSTNGYVRYWAVHSMYLFYKDKASLAAPALRNMLNDPDYRIRMDAEEMLARIESTAPTNAPPQ